MTAFAEFVSRTRRGQGKTLLDLSAALMLSSGNHPSVVYLSDIERDKRNPPDHVVLAQWAKFLGVSPDVLYFRAGIIPPDIAALPLSDDKALSAIQALREYATMPLAPDWTKPDDM